MINWIKAKEFSTQFEAEMARARLESARIPATIKTHEAGLFGAGFQGVVPSGVELHVPTNRLNDARDVLATEDDTQAE